MNGRALKLTTKRSIAAVLLAIFCGGASFWFLRHRSAPEKPVAAVYVDSAVCVSCHVSEAAGYARTGMAHAFSKPVANDTVDSPAKDHQFYHAVSGTHYEMTEHDGRFFQRRWQQGFDGSPDNVEELAIDYIMGSGNHVRTYLHREQDDTLIELPLAWYSEDGGHWGMNPGFDNPKPMTRRAIAYECMFCHNGYPAIPPPAHRDLSARAIYGPTLPEGIDCQRCHGPGAAHVKAAQTSGSSLEEIRTHIVNPVRLSNDRQMEVCEQCHLETTSHLLPDRIRKYDRDPFSYRAGEPLADFNAYFARDPQKGRTDNFEIVNAPYRLRQSQCYLKTGGALTCETCHNPHDLHKGPESAAYYTGVCMKCHGASLPQKIALRQHPASPDCVSCHMPKRRTEDVVHAIMTDHLIQRQPPPAKELLAARQELPDTYRGPVTRYLLDHQSEDAADALYDAAAQVIDSSNLEAGVPQLTNAIREQRPSQPNFSIELGDAMRHAGDLNGAIAAYRQAIALDPHSSRAQRRLGSALGSAGQDREGLAVLASANAAEPDNPLLWYEQAVIHSKMGSFADSIADLHKSLQIKPDFADAQNNLGSNLAQTGDTRGAEAAFRAAMAVDPYNSEIRSNLGRLLARESDWKQAAFQLQKAVQLDPANARAHSDYAIVLLQMQRLAEAEAEAQAAVKAGTPTAGAHDLLGQIFARKGEIARARTEFESAIKLNPNFSPAQLDLAEALIQQGHTESALPLLEKAAHSTDPRVAERAVELLHLAAAKK